MTPVELAQRLSNPQGGTPFLLDVREPWEFTTCHIAGAVAMPMRSIPLRLTELDIDAEIVCICHHGARSLQVAHFLERNGFMSVTNLSGGIHAWAQQVDPAMPVY